MCCAFILAPFGLPAIMGLCRVLKRQVGCVSDRASPARTNGSPARLREPVRRAADRRHLQTGSLSALLKSTNDKVQPQPQGTAAPHARSDAGHLARTPAPGRKRPTTLSGKLGRAPQCSTQARAGQTAGQTRAGQTARQSRAGQTAGQTRAGQTAVQTRAGQTAGLHGKGETLWTSPAAQGSAVHRPLTATAGTRRTGGIGTREVCAGSQHLSQALQAEGCRIQPIDIAIGGQDHDLSIADNVDRLKADDTEDYNHYAPPCNTYSSCRMPKIRSASFPEGLRGLGVRDRQLLTKANRITNNVGRLLLGHCEVGHAWSIENPSGSLIWRTRAWRRVLRLAKPSKALVNYCQFGMPYRKRTTVFTWSPGDKNFLAELSVPCTCKRHAQTLSSWDRNTSRRLPTKKGSAAYPPALCKAWARAVAQHLRRR